jgi:hypothetical protein
MYSILTQYEIIINLKSQLNLSPQKISLLLTKYEIVRVPRPECQSACGDEENLCPYP